MHHHLYRSKKPRKPKNLPHPMNAMNTVERLATRLAGHLEIMEQTARAPLAQIVQQQASPELASVLNATCESLKELIARAQHDVAWLDERADFVERLVFSSRPKVVHGRVRPVAL